MQSSRTMKGEECKLFVGGKDTFLYIFCLPAICGSVPLTLVILVLQQEPNLCYFQGREK